MKQPNVTTATSDEIVSFLKFKIRELFGDKAENTADVYGIRGGWYYIDIPELGWRTGGFRRTSLSYVVHQLNKLRREKAKGK